jgi:autotransporter-associated beta strand protein
LGATTLANQTVAGVVARGNVIVAGTYEISGFATDKNTGALYRSTDGGATFTAISGTAGTGLPAGAVSSVMGDPTTSSRLYAAVTAPNAGGNASTALYISNDTGATWTKVFDATNSAGTIQSGSQTILKIATGPSGAVAVGVVDLGTGTGKLTGVFWSGNSGTSWTNFTSVPNVNSVNQGSANFAIAIDPNNKNLVYVSGDELASAANFTVSAFRLNAAAPGTFTSITDARTADGSTVHSDSRAIAFDANGRLLLTSDGTIYARTNPQNDTGAWTRLSGNVSAFESYVVGYDAVGKRLITAAQDNGVTIQSGRNAPQWNAMMGADGVNAFVNDVTLAAQGQTAFYGSYFNLLGPVRIILDQQGNQISPNNTAGGEYFAVGATVTCNHTDCGSYVVGASPDAGFSSPWVNNRIDPTRMALAGTHVYVTQDTLTGAQGPSATTVDLTLTELGDAGANILKIAYGTRDNPNMLVAAGDGSHFLWQSTTAAGGSLVPVTAYAPAGGDLPTGLVLDPRSQQRYYVADFTNIWGTTNQGTSFTKLTSNLPASFIRPTAVEFISNNGVNALVVGGSSNVADAQSTITIADSDANGILSNWRLFGTGLPNSQVSALFYSQAADVLAVGTFGRGVFTLYDVTSYFAQATTLQFGLADNDSMPDASFLTNGTSANRALIKYGTGTLTIAGNATYTGGTTINDGALVLGNGGAGGGSIIGNVTFCSNAADTSCNATTGKSLVFNRSDTYTFGGAITGPGQVFQAGSGTTILTGTSTYSGTTFVDSGTLLVHGSITSSVTVESGATLGGNGEVGHVTIMPGGIYSPGASVGTHTVNGNLLFNPGGIYFAEIGGGTADRIKVTGTATLGGAVVASFLDGHLTNHYTILSAAGGRTGTFDDLVPLNAPAFVTASLAYTPTTVDLNLTSGLGQVAGLTGNQAAVAAALDNSFNTGKGTLSGLSGVGASQLPAAMAMLSGEGISGTQDTAFGAAGMFMSMMMDQGAFWRSGESIDVNGVTMSGQPMQYAPSAKAGMSEHPAFKAIAQAQAFYQPRWRAWATGFDGTWKLNGEPGIGSDTLSHNTGGMAGGLDYQFAPDVLAGLAFGGSSSNFSAADRFTSGHLDGAHFGGYGVKTWGPLYAAAAMSFSTYRNSTTRTIAGVGPLETATGSFGSNLLGGRLEVGSKHIFGRFSVTPFAAVQFAQLWQKGFTEANVAPAGAGVLGLTERSVAVSSLPVFLGAQFDSRFYLPSGMTVSPYARLSWVHELNPNRQVTASFIALPETSFTVDGPRAARDAARIEVGSKLALTRSVKAFASFDGEFSDRTQAYAGKGGITIAW